MPKKTSFDEALDQAFANIVEDKIEEFTIGIHRLEHATWDKVLKIIPRQDPNGPPVHLNSPTLVVRHAKLKRDGSDSPYRSDCPVCGYGVLLVGRDARTSQLLADDRCLLCGQHVVYEDIEDMRARLG